jgi:hypothetical protein
MVGLAECGAETVEADITWLFQRAPPTGCGFQPSVLAGEVNQGFTVPAFRVQNLADQNVMIARAEGSKPGTLKRREYAREQR